MNERSSKTLAAFLWIDRLVPLLTGSAWAAPEVLAITKSLAVLAVEVIVLQLGRLD
jgi:hypothetical protein